MLLIGNQSDVFHLHHGFQKRRANALSSRSLSVSLSLLSLSLSLSVSLAFPICLCLHVPLLSSLFSLSPLYLLSVCLYVCLTVSLSLPLFIYIYIYIIYIYFESIEETKTKDQVNRSSHHRLCHSWACFYYSLYNIFIMISQRWHNDHSNNIGD